MSTKRKKHLNVTDEMIVSAMQKTLRQRSLSVTPNGDCLYGSRRKKSHCAVGWLLFDNFPEMYEKVLRENPEDNVYVALDGWVSSETLKVLDALQICHDISVPASCQPTELALFRSSFKNACLDSPNEQIREFAVKAFEQSP